MDTLSVAFERLLYVLLLLGFELHVIVEASSIVTKGLQVETFLHLANEWTLLMGIASASYRHFHIKSVSRIPP